MSNTPPLSEQFAYPTMRQHQDEAQKRGEARWDTAVGRRNFHITVEKFIAAQLANPDIFCAAKYPLQDNTETEDIYSDIIGNITANAFVVAENMYAELEDRRNGLT